MKVDLLNKANSTFILLMIILTASCSCEKDSPQVKPLWFVELTRGSYKENEAGFHSPIIYKDYLLYTSCIEGYKYMALCGVNTITHKVDWTYPKGDTNLNLYSLLSSSSYIKDDYIVFKANTSIPYDDVPVKVLCVDLKTQTTLWEKEYDGYEGAWTDMTGHEDKFFFCKNDRELLQGDVLTGNTETLFLTTEHPLYKDYYIEQFYFVHINGEDMLAFTLYDFIDRTEDEPSKFYYDLCLLDINSKELTPVNSWYVENFSVDRTAIEDNKFYYYIEDRINGSEYGCIDLEKQEKVWSKGIDNKLFACRKIIVGEEWVYYTSWTTAGGLVVFDKQTGKEEYISYELGIYMTDRGLEYNGYLYLCTDYVKVIDIKTMSIVATLQCPYEDHALGCVDPIIVDDKLYLLGNYMVYCYPTYPWTK